MQVIYRLVSSLTGRATPSLHRHANPVSRRGVCPSPRADRTGLPGRRHENRPGGPPVQLARLLAFIVTAIPGHSAEPITLPAILAEVRARHPQIRAAAAIAAADRERIQQSDTWDDPIAGVEFQQAGHRQLASYDAAEFSVSQRIPLSGNRERRRAVATAAADVALAGVRTREFLLLGETSDTFFQLLRAREQLALTQASGDWLAQATTFSRQRLAAGSGRLSELISAETEQAQLDGRVVLLQREIADAAARLNTLRDLPPQTPVPELSPPPLPSKEVNPAGFPSLEAAQAHAFSHRPDLHEAQARIIAAQRVRELADRAWRPDPEVIFKARHLATGGRLIESYDTGFAVSLPWFNDKKYRSMQREADRRREAAELEADTLRSKTAAEIREMWQRVTTAQHQLEIYQQRLLPLARQNAASLKEDLALGKATIPEVIAAHRAWVEAQVIGAAHLADFHRFHALLHVLVGSPGPS